MRSIRGFTLIEVIVALAITAGALVMLASVGNESLRRSLRSRHSAILDQACQNKLAECACGAEGGREGEFASLPGWRWKVETESVPMDGTHGIERVTLRAHSTEGQGSEKLLSLFRYRAGTQP
jgi:prepilin-type N-terminal cleavage/methylation domain-containing protein